MASSPRQLSGRLSLDQFQQKAASWAGMIDDHVKAARKGWQHLAGQDCDGLHSARRWSKTTRLFLDDRLSIMKKALLPMSCLYSVVSITLSSRADGKDAIQSTNRSQDSQYSQYISSR